MNKMAGTSFRGFCFGGKSTWWVHDTLIRCLNIKVPALLTLTRLQKPSQGQQISHDTYNLSEEASNAYNKQRWKRQSVPWMRHLPVFCRQKGAVAIGTRIDYVYFTSQYCAQRNTAVRNITEGPSIPKFYTQRLRKDRMYGKGERPRTMRKGRRNLPANRPRPATVETRSQMTSLYTSKISQEMACASEFPSFLVSFPTSSSIGG